MRKFFSFKLSSSNNANNGTKSPASSDEDFWEKPKQNGMETSRRESLESPRNSVFKKPNKFQESRDSPGCHRRSLSLSSSSFLSGSGEACLDSRNGPSSSSTNASHDATKCMVETSCHSLTPERLPKSRRRDSASLRKIHACENIISPRSLKDYHCSSGNSRCSSPVPLRCRSARAREISNKNDVLDLYIEGEHQEINSRKERHSSNTVNVGFLAEDRSCTSSGRPPRMHSTAPASPAYSKDSLRCQSLREVRDIRHYLSFQDDDSKSASQETRMKFSQNLSSAFPGRTFLTKSLDYDSEATMKTEDIYEDLSELRPGASLDSFDQSLLSRKQNYFHVAGSDGAHRESSPSLEQQGDNIDRDLVMELKEAEDRFKSLSAINLESGKLHDGNVCVSALLQMIKDINGDRQNLALEVLTQIQCRIAERSSTKDVKKQANTALDARIRRLEKEKDEIQLTLEKELDRRSSDWSIKLEKFQAEEERLRERVRELAEKNVSLQREVSSLSAGELESRNKIMSLVTQVNDLTAKLEQVKVENQNLHSAMSELQESSHSTEADRDCLKISYKEKEKENKELQKAVVRFQRICSEQEKTISGLRDAYSVEIGKQLPEGAEHINRLKLEQVRLAGIEQTLRKEVESYRHEVKSLTHENLCLLDRLKNTANGCGISMFRLHEELRSQVECLQNLGISLLNDNSELCGKLIDFVKSKQCEHGQETDNNFAEHSFIEYNIHFQNLKRGMESFKRRLQIIAEVLDEKYHLEGFEHQSQTVEVTLTKQQKKIRSEDDLELELKTETLLTRVLREKLCAKELELEQLQGEISSLVRGREIQRYEIQRLQDELSCMTHKTNAKELQMQMKEENFNQLERDLEECTKELIVTRGLLSKVSEERDHLWEEVKKSKEINMLLKYEVESLKRKVEVLDEDVLVKEGQITILKDSLGSSHPFNILCSSKPLNECDLE